MKPRFTALLMLYGAALLAVPAHAKTVWRCGEGGKVYADSPCAGGRAVEVADPRSNAEAQAAHANIKREQDLATRMRNERLAEEKRNLAANGRAANMGPSKPPAAQATTLKPKAARKPSSKRRPGAAEAAGDGTLRAAGVPFRRKKD